MSKGLSQQQRRILEVLEPNKARAIGDLAYTLTDDKPTRSQVESTRRAVKSLEKRGLVKTAIAKPNAFYGEFNELVCWRADAPPADITINGMKLAMRLHDEPPVSGRVVEAAITETMRGERFMRWSALSRIVRRKVWAGSFGTWAEYTAFRRAIDNMVARGEIRVNWVYDGGAEGYRRSVSVEQSRKDSDTSTLITEGGDE